MADMTGGELVAKVLKQAGVRHAFTLCGGHILPIYDGCVTEGIALIDLRHEQAAAHAADAYARLTRNIGVALVTAGPGVTDAVTGVANAHSARSPLLLIGGAAPLENGMELETAARFGLPITCVIGNDGGWGQIRSPQISFWGEDRAVATSLPFTRYDLMVEALGGRGSLITRPEEIRPALEKALASDEVSCLNVVLDPAAYRKTGRVSMAI